MTEEIIEYRVRSLESTVGEIKAAVISIDKSLQLLSQLEAHHAETRDGLSRAFATIKESADEQEKHNDDYEERLRLIESQMPTLKLVSGWVIGGVLGTIGIVGSAAIVLVMK